MSRELAKRKLSNCDLKKAILRTAVVTRSDKIRTRELVIEGLHNSGVTDDHGSTTVNDRIDGTGDLLPVEI